MLQSVWILVQLCICNCRRNCNWFNTKLQPKGHQNQAIETEGQFEKKVRACGYTESEMEGQTYPHSPPNDSVVVQNPPQRIHVLRTVVADYHSDEISLSGQIHTSHCTASTPSNLPSSHQLQVIIHRLCYSFWHADWDVICSVVFYLVCVRDRLSESLLKRCYHRAWLVYNWHLSDQPQLIERICMKEWVKAYVIIIKGWLIRVIESIDKS